ncbi:tripartite tricarboxylate transporter substrate binding protein [Polynucleobacter sp. AP-Melu-500A-A1]|uniref:tripartite tricarboxylate transporter substrate binding protein n=1 Tax=Polynucleobacter sp. AP-Melu-500A-A1 TaxID=2576929 RepID=UPI001C0B2355|nr:tripartite tricarboxylate transporter substrate binding protein [Polynucleobacter sp. AP-Melu-500A-A1]MBU3630594.1 tripartite tricarboxylate transporter substrate binding protein [Polynucleobacter sp. AP-Melu-500A-A1]
MYKNLKIIVCTLFFFVSFCAFAQNVKNKYPDKPIELVVLFPVGSSADIVARIFADNLSKELGTQIVVNNKPGAGGAIGYKYVAGKNPDGYSLVWSSNSILSTYYSGALNVDYQGFDHIARATIELPVVAVKADSPWKNLKDMLDYVRAHPEEVRVGNSGVGSFTHYAGASFFDAQGVKVTHVPYSSSQVVTSLMGGNIEAVVQAPGALMPFVNSGGLRVLGVLGSRREPAFPNVPTAAEQGIQFQADMWRGVSAPKGTPKEISARIQAAMQKTLASPEFKKQCEKNGCVASYADSMQFLKDIASENYLVASFMKQTLKNN